MSPHGEFAARPFFPTVIVASVGRMSRSILKRPGALLAIGTFIILGLLSLLVEVDLGPEGDGRPIGTVADIEKLKERDDLNVLYILIDTLRSDRLGTYGYHRDTSPALDARTSTGIRFDRNLAQSSWTKCSMASMWTGFYPPRTGVKRFDDILSDEATLPAEVLQKAGFHTVGLYRNGWVSPNFGFAQGFDVYTRPASRPQPPAVRAKNPTITQRGTDEDAVAAALEFLRVHGHKNWFLYLHLMDIHEYTYDQHTALFGSTYTDIYDNSIRWVDHLVNLLLEHLSADGYADNTIVVISADHGEAFRERGLEGHARTIFKETTEVPFIILLPFELEEGIVVNSRSRNVDVWPTVLDLLGLSLPGETDGRSLLPDILLAARGESVPDPLEPGLAYLDQHWGQEGEEPLPSVSLVEGTRRYVRSSHTGTEREHLFDAAVDAGEMKDLAESDPEDVERMRSIADEYLEQKPDWGAAPTRALGEMELNQLRALGYALPK
jgi:arylsulfatase A-like enzyme